MRYSEITEAPISNFELIGDFSRATSFRDANDRKLLTNPKAVKKIQHQWRNTEQNFNILMVNHADAINHFKSINHSETGMVDEAWLDKNFPSIRDQIKIDPNAVNVIYIGNAGAERVPMTGWIMAHRLGHALWRNFRSPYGKQGPRTPSDPLHEVSAQIMSTINNIAEHGYNAPKIKQYEIGKSLALDIMHGIGKFRSARERNIRNVNEFIYECLAQYIFSGEVSFNSIPDIIKCGRESRQYQGGEYSKRCDDGQIDDLADWMNHSFAESLGRAVGEIYVM